MIWLYATTLSLSLSTISTKGILFTRCNFHKSVSNWTRKRFSSRRTSLLHGVVKKSFRFFVRFPRFLRTNAKRTIRGFCEQSSARVRQSRHVRFRGEEDIARKRLPRWMAHLVGASHLATRKYRLFVTIQENAALACARERACAHTYTYTHTYTYARYPWRKLAAINHFFFFGFLPKNLIGVCARARLIRTRVPILSLFKRGISMCRTVVSCQIFPQIQRANNKDQTSATSNLLTMFKQSHIFAKIMASHLVRTNIVYQTVAIKCRADIKSAIATRVVPKCFTWIM